jgi:hypothetical protein
MKRVLAVVVALLIALPLRSLAQDWTAGEFDARILTPEDKRIVQAALVFSGDYVGFLDGHWGKSSQAALERYTLRTRGNPKPTFDDLRPMLTDFAGEWARHRWKIDHNLTTTRNFSFAYPQGLLSGKLDDSVPDALTLDSADRSLSLGMYFRDASGSLAIHDYLQRNAVAQPYVSVKPDRYITSASLPDQVVAYVSHPGR